MEKSVKLEMLLSKLGQPLSLEFISNNLLNMSEFETKEYLNELVEDGIIIKENNYYTIKNKK
jgi:biotin operon repressor